MASYLAYLTWTGASEAFQNSLSEKPIVVQVSTQLTHDLGWDSPLWALKEGRIVEVGFRGELLTKIVSHCNGLSPGCNTDVPLTGC